MRLANSACKKSEAGKVAEIKGGSDDNDIFFCTPRAAQNLEGRVHAGIVEHAEDSQSALKKSLHPPGSGGGATQLAHLIEGAIDVHFVAGEQHCHALVLGRVARGRPLNLALPPMCILFCSF